MLKMAWGSVIEEGVELVAEGAEVATGVEAS